MGKGAEGRIIFIDNSQTNLKNSIVNKDFESLGIDSSRDTEQSKTMDAIFSEYKKETEICVFLEQKYVDKFNSIKNVQKKAQNYAKHFHSFRDYIKKNIKRSVDKNKKMIFLITKSNLYVEFNERAIYIYFGPSAIFSLLLNQEKNKISSQDGACLCYYLLPNGQLVTILYPAKNNMFSVAEDNILLRCADYYTSLTLLDYLYKDLYKLFIYQSISDIDIQASFYEKTYYKWLRFRYPTKRKESDYYSYSQIIKKEVMKNGIVTVIFKIIGCIFILVWMLYSSIVK